MNPRKTPEKFGDCGTARTVKRLLTISLTLSKTAPLAGVATPRTFEMRTVFVSLFALLYISQPPSAQAERRMFIVANDADGYGVDRCLAAGEKCGAAAANAYCKTQAFAQATAYHKVDRADLTAAITDASSGDCGNGLCDAVAIVCTR